MQAENIDGVIGYLESIINDSIKSNRRAGYFASLYHRVTCRVKEGITSGEFVDGSRMEKFVVIFANRYLAAYDEWTVRNMTLSLSWKIAFEALNKSAILVLQHLFLGMNAHINLDLGIAVLKRPKLHDQPLESLHNDFNKINTILAALSYEVINEINQISPLLSLIGLHSKNNSLLSQFALNNARDGAWCFAENLFTKNGEQYTNCFNQRDQDIYNLGKTITEVKGFLKVTIIIIYLFEAKNPSKIVNILNTYKKVYLKVNGTQIS